jgi:hypothetical protein
MQRLVYLALFSLAGCPPPPRYVVADVFAANAPVQDAMVAADCGRERDAALRTDDTGRVRLPIRGRAAADRCVLTIAKPGYHTVETGGVQLCSKATACPTVFVRLFEAYGFAPAAPRTYASPAAEVAQ